MGICLGIPAAVALLQHRRIARKHLRVANVAYLTIWFYLPRLLELLPPTFRVFGRTSPYLELVASIMTC